jgi:hypothetical protein
MRAPSAARAGRGDSIFGRIFYGKPVATFPENALPRIVITLEVTVRA